MQEFHRWLIDTFGKPDVEVSGKPVGRERFRGIKGVIVFDINFGLSPDGVTRALGHADLWDGQTFFDEIYGISTPQRDFCAIAGAVCLWRSDGKLMLPRTG